jgi:hypothetical protein
MPAIFTTYRALKYLSNLSLISSFDVIRVEELFLADFPYNLRLCILPRVYLRLITPND